MLPRLCCPSSLFGRSYWEQSLCKVPPPSPVYPYEKASTRFSSSFFVFEVNTVIGSIVGAFLLFWRGVALFWC